MEVWDHNIVVLNGKHKSDQVENLKICKRGNTLCHNFYSSQFLNKLTVRNKNKINFHEEIGVLNIFNAFLCVLSELSTLFN